jgi:hypothetical protein
MASRTIGASGAEHNRQLGKACFPGESKKAGVSRPFQTK